MRARSLFLLAIVLLSVSVDAAPRRRAVGKRIAYDESTPGGWLAANAYVLSTPDLVPFTGDLLPLRAMIGSADVVALGDGTHGTHEFYTVKLRVIDTLVREAGFDQVAFEGSFPLMNRLNTYVQGGAGDPRALLHEMRDLYFFWDVEEIVSVVEWMREYNAHRGTRPAVQITGFDVLEPYPASREVIAYLHTVDPAGAVTTEEQYKCLPESAVTVPQGCYATAVLIRDALAARQAELTAISTEAAFQEALHNARVVVQSAVPVGPGRDDAMAENALWLRDHRGSTRKMILWAHNAHISRTSNEWAHEQPMGKTLAESLGSDYFTIATLTAAGTFLQFDIFKRIPIVSTLPPLQATAYESYIRQRGEPYLLIPLRGALPSWLTIAARYNTAAVSGPAGLVESLPEHYDAAIYIETTRATEPIQN